jgi:hypothetical protein
MSQSRSQADHQLLLDDESIIQEFTLVPINTAEILQRLDHNNLDRLKKILQPLEKIRCKERVKYLLPASGIALGLSTLGTASYFLTYLLTLPTYIEEYAQAHPKPDFMGQYLNTPISGTHETCGARFADTSALEPSSFCSSFFEPEAALVQAYKNKCHDWAITDFSTWHKIAGYGWDCYNYAKEHLDCTSYQSAKSYYSLRVSDCVSGAPDYLPCSYFYQPYRNPPGPHGMPYCAVLPTIDIQCSSLAKNVYDAGIELLAKFNTALMPGTNNTCADLYVSDKAFKQCQTASITMSLDKEYWEDHFHDKWPHELSLMRSIREVFTAVYVIVTFVALLASIILFKYGMSFVKTKKKMTDVSSQDDLGDSFTLQVYKPNRDTDKATVTEIVDELHAHVTALELDFDALSKRRVSYMMVLNKLDILLPTEINRKILFYARLFSYPPLEKNETDPQVMLGVASNKI